MAKKVLFKFVQEETPTQNSRLLIYEPGHEDKVIEFLMSLTNHELYKECLLDLNARLEENPELKPSIQKIINGIQEHATAILNEPVMRPSEVFRGRG